MWQAVYGTDQGGDQPNAPALPAQGQNGHLQAVRRRAKRQKKAYELVFNHIDNERLKDMLDDLPDNGDKGRAAWLLILAECDLGTANAIKMYLTGTENMMADIFTKPVDKTTFLRCRAYIMG